VNSILHSVNLSRFGVIWSRSAVDVHGHSCAPSFPGNGHCKPQSSSDLRDGYLMTGRDEGGILLRTRCCRRGTAPSISVNVRLIGVLLACEVRMSKSRKLGPRVESEVAMTDNQFASTFRCRVAQRWRCGWSVSIS